MKNVIYFILFCLVIFIVAANYQFENGAYHKYAISILEDRDFNIFNQQSKIAEKWMVTASGNHPDFHHSTISSFLLPFYILPSIFHQNEIWSKRTRFLDITINLMFFVLGIMLLRKTFQEIHSQFFVTWNKSLFLCVFLTSICTTLIVYPTDTVLILMFVSAVAFDLLVKYAKGSIPTITDAIILGFCAVVRTEMYFIAPVFVYWLIKSDTSVSKKMVWIATFLIPSCLIGVDRYIRFGYLSNFLAHHVNLDFPYYFYLLKVFSSEGCLYYSPGLMLIALGTCWAFRSKELMPYRIIFMSYAFGAVLMFVLLLGVPTMVDNTLYDRHIVPFFPILVCAMFFILEHIKQEKKHFIFLKWATIFICVITFYSKSYYIITEYTNKGVLGGPYWKGLDFFLNFKNLIFERSQDFWISMKENSMQILYLGPCFVVIFYADKIINAYRKIILSFFGLYLFMGILNVFNNQKNVTIGRVQGIFSEALVCGGSFCFYDDYIDVLDLGIKQFEIASRLEFAKMNEIKKKKFIEKNWDNILYDPIGFKQRYLNGEIRPSFWRLLD